ncbi:hypothetical protein HYR99_23790 [Candidatus Poribacteria bacterium]|nr:hypothetical protein [Candidatus Poribacteria bacterium]
MRRTKVLGLLFILSFTFVSLVSTQDEVIVFVGHPKVKMLADGVKDGVLEEVPQEKVVEFSCVISKIGDKYYWTSRDKWEVMKIKSGAFITFKRLDRPDYVRVIEPESKEAVALLSETVVKFDYVEHLTINLSSVTYWGKIEHIDPVIY